MVAWLPFVATAVGDAQRFLLGMTALWGLAVTGYIGYRMLERGYLPYAERVARATGLHGRIGPGRKNDES